jgi:hypothetical protein
MEAAARPNGPLAGKGFNLAASLSWGRGLSTGIFWVFYPAGTGAAQNPMEKALTRFNRDDRGIGTKK